MAEPITTGIIFAGGMLAKFAQNIFTEYAGSKTEPMIDNFLYGFKNHDVFKALHEAWQKAKEHGLERPHLPLIIPLHDHARLENLTNILLRFFDTFRHGRTKMNPDVFHQLNRMGKLLIIFDGFDEMAVRVDRHRMINHFEMLTDAVMPNAKVILTSRMEHFPTMQIRSDLFTGGEHQFETLTLNRFSHEQIKQILRLHNVEQKMLKKIMDMEALRDLAERPVMIDLILEAMPTLEKSEDLPIDLSRIYLYAVTNILDKINAPRSLTSTADKLYFLCELAWEMLSTNQLSLNYRDFPDMIKAIFGLEKSKEIDYWDWDLRNQAMLIRNEDGDYRFGNKSLAEFFVAYKFAAEMGALHEDFMNLARSVEKATWVDSSLPAEDYTWYEYFREGRHERKALVEKFIFSFDGTDIKFEGSVWDLLNAMLIFENIEDLDRDIRKKIGKQNERCFNCLGKLKNVKNQTFMYSGEKKSGYGSPTVYKEIKKLPVIKWIICRGTGDLKDYVSRYKCIRCKWLGISHFITEYG